MESSFNLHSKHFSLSQILRTRNCFQTSSNHLLTTLNNYSANQGWAHNLTNWSIETLRIYCKVRNSSNSQFKILLKQNLLQQSHLCTICCKSVLRIFCLVLWRICSSIVAWDVWRKVSTSHYFILPQHLSNSTLNSFQKHEDAKMIWRTFRKLLKRISKEEIPIWNDSISNKLAIRT